MKMNIVFAALIAANLAACGQQEQATEETQAPVTTEAPAMDTAPAETPAMDAGMEAAPVEGEAPVLEGTEEAVDSETEEATEEPPVG